MGSFRQTIEQNSRIAVGAAAVLFLGVGLYLEFGSESPIERAANHRVYFDPESGKAFEVTIKTGMTMPPKSPYSGKADGVEPEACFWTPDGKVKDTPDLVLLNSLHVPPIAGPTFCPICHRRVVAGNPRPRTDDTPPPTELEYRMSH